MTNTLTKARAYLGRKKREGWISHWEIELSDSSAGFFGVRVSRAVPGPTLVAALCLCGTSFDLEVTR